MQMGDENEKQSEDESTPYAFRTDRSLIDKRNSAWNRVCIEPQFPKMQSSRAKSKARDKEPKER